MRTKRFLVVTVLSGALGGCSDSMDDVLETKGGATTDGGSGGAAENGGPSEDSGSEPSGSGGTSGGAGGGNGMATGGSGGIPVASGGSPSIDGSSEVSFDGTKITARITIRTEPGEEHVDCVVVELPNTDPIWVDRLVANYGPGGHHLLVDRAPDGAAVQPDPSACWDTNLGAVARYIASPSQHREVTLPEGVAFPIDAGQRLILKLHTINTSDRSQETTGSVELVVADDPEPIEARSTFVGMSAPTLPPNTGNTTYGEYRVEPSGTIRHVFGLTPEMHFHVENLTAWRTSEGFDASAEQMLVQSIDWLEPDTSAFSPPVSFDDDNFLRFACNYLNDTDQVLTFSNGERCGVWMSYYDE